MYFHEGPLALTLKKVVLIGLQFLEYDFNQIIVRCVGLNLSTLLVALSDLHLERYHIAKIFCITHIFVHLRK